MATPSSRAITHKTNFNLPYENLLVLGNLPSAVFYKTSEWKNARYRALLAHGNKCQLCGATSQSGPLEVDHIFPRVLRPELCLDPTNLQILCNQCHSAKGVKYIDDCRKRHKQDSKSITDLIKVDRMAVVLTQRPPKQWEVKLLHGAARAQSKNIRKRWGMFLKYCAQSQSTYYEAASVTVQDFLSQPFAKDHRFHKFLLWPAGAKKNPDDLFFDIDGHAFPKSMTTLLADD